MTSLKIVLAAALGMLYGCGGEPCKHEENKYALGQPEYTERYENPDAHMMDLSTLEAKIDMHEYRPDQFTGPNKYKIYCRVEPSHPRFEYLLVRMKKDGDYSFIGSTEGLPMSSIASSTIGHEELEETESIKCNVFLPDWNFVVGKDEYGNEITKWQSRTAVGTVEAPVLVNDTECYDESYDDDLDSDLR
ncbi:MAG: hypothetical protein V1729_05645 [Candidatus Woesearchaeota archaeon]